MNKEQIKQMIVEEIKFMDDEIKDGLYDIWLEPTTNTIRLDESGLAYQGDDKEAYEVAQIENQEIINWK